MATATAKKIYRSERQVQREANILATVREALTDKGYDGVTMDGLAQQAGVVKKTLYNLYGSKDALLLTAISEIIQDYRHVDDQEAPGIPSIIASRIAATNQVVSSPAYADVMTKAVTQVPSDHSLVTMLMRDSVSFQREHLAVAKAKSELLPNTDIDAIAEQIVSQGWGMTLMSMKDVIRLNKLPSQSLSGLLFILTSITTGARRDALVTLLNETTGGKIHGTA